MHSKAATLALLFVACAGEQTANVQTPADLDRDLASEEVDVFDLDTPVEIERSRSGSIDRTALDSILERGIGLFLTKVEVRPVVDSGAFRGWQVVRYDHPWVDLQPGDIVRSINGNPVESPTEAQVLWAKLSSAGEIVVEVARENEDFELRFSIDG